MDQEKNNFTNNNSTTIGGVTFGGGSPSPAPAGAFQSTPEPANNSSNIQLPQRIPSLLVQIAHLVKMVFLKLLQLVLRILITISLSKLSPMRQILLRSRQRALQLHKTT